MAIQIETEANGFVNVKISNLMTVEDMKRCEEAIISAINLYGKAKGLLIIEAFQANQGNADLSDSHITSDMDDDASNYDSPDDYLSTPSLDTEERTSNLEDYSEKELLDTIE